MTRATGCADWQMAGAASVLSCMPPGGCGRRAQRLHAWLRAGRRGQCCISGTWALGAMIGFGALLMCRSRHAFSLFYSSCWWRRGSDSRPAVWCRSFV